MELSILTRLRVAGAVAFGAVVIGFLAWPLAGVSDPYGAVSLLVGDMSFFGAIGLLLLAAATGFVAYFVCWPYGREIGILAVPAGLAVWVFRSGTMTEIIRANLAVSRQDLFSQLRLEPVFWLLVVGAGFIGVLAAQITKPAQKSYPGSESGSASNTYLNIALAILVSAVIAKLGIGIFAQGARIAESRVGSLVAQPAKAQIVFAVLVSFALAGFVIKELLDAGYIWATVAAGLVSIYSMAFTRKDALEYLAGYYPPVFFINSACAILPVEMLTFGALGSVAGYWLAVRFEYWRKHEMG